MTAPRAEAGAGGRFSRRSLLTAIGAGGLVAAGAAAGASAMAATAPARQVGADRYEFYGEHQAGIVTPAQDHLYFVALDVTTEVRSQLVSMLQRWTAAAAAMTAGDPVGGRDLDSYEAPPTDTGEALDLPASGLTLTIGFGPSLFTDPGGRPRFGLAGARPEALVDLPHFPADALDSSRCGGDLAIQACADDPQVAVHAVRNLVRLAFGVAAVRWSQLGFGRTSTTSSVQTTARNMFGFKDGTANIKAEDSAQLARHVWVDASDGPGWLAGGSYLVVRRIRMMIETWDRTTLREQEAIIGRTKREGAPLSGGEEFTAPDFGVTGGAGRQLIPADSHLRLAHPDQNDGARMLRRGYNYTDGSSELGRLDAGLFFMAYQRDIRTAFLPVQTRLARKDSLSEYLQHTGSAVFAMPPGPRGPDDWWGATVLA
jgi:deferrochelatase/peroxidase EfeB